MNRKLLGALGILLLFGGGISPVAEINDKIVSIFPVWNNFTVDNGLWQWMDISFFAITLFIILFLLIYFVFKTIPYGLMISGFISLFIITILFFTILQLKYKYALYGDITFKLQWGWFLLLIGTVLILMNSLSRSK